MRVWLVGTTWGRRVTEGLPDMSPISSEWEVNTMKTYERRVFLELLGFRHFAVKGVFEKQSIKKYNLERPGLERFRSCFHIYQTIYIEVIILLWHNPVITSFSRYCNSLHPTPQPLPRTANMKGDSSHSLNKMSHPTNNSSSPPPPSTVNFPC